MEKKYQVFISSTYKDLKEERQKVIEVLLHRNCIPVGMEFFPSANEDIQPMIKRFIDDCDYYLLIIGDEYGSVNKKGKSYTQLEYEYAVKQNKKPLAVFLKEESLCKKDVVNKIELDNFRSLFQEKSRKYWKNADDLAAQVCLSLGPLIENNPREGWVKASGLSSDDANRELLALRDENKKLKNQIAFLTSSIPIGTEDFQRGEDLFQIHYEICLPMQDDEFPGLQRIKIIAKTWNELFSSISTLLLNPTDENSIKRKLEESFLSDYNEIIEDDFQTIMIQLMALKLINIIPATNIYQTNRWMLTSYGRVEMVRLKALRKSSAEKQ